MLYTCNLTDIL